MGQTPRVGHGTLARGRGATSRIITNRSGLAALKEPSPKGTRRDQASSSKALVVLVGACPKEGSVG